MGTSATIELDSFLKPISEAKPSGKDAREVKDFDVLKEARREEEALSQGEWVRDAKTADWAKVIRTATKILEQESKDLQVAAWLVEGLVKRHGFPGLRDGLSLLRTLHETFWDTLHPAIEDGDLEYRAGRLEALNKVLPPAIKAIPLTKPPGGTPYSYIDYQQSQEVENLRRGAATDVERKRQLDDALADGKLEGEQFEKSVAATPLAHCSALLEDLSECWDEIEKLDAVLDEKYGKDAPSLRLLKEAIGDCRFLINSIVKKKGGVGLEGPQAEAGADGNGAGQEAGPGPGGIASGPVKDREEALRRLESVADFFRRTEPHSPVAYLVQRAARWGRMPLDEWLHEVIKNDSVLGEVKETLGIKGP